MRRWRPGAVTLRGRCGDTDGLGDTQEQRLKSTRGGGTGGRGLGATVLPTVLASPFTVVRAVLSQQEDLGAPCHPHSPGRPVRPCRELARGHDTGSVCRNC